MTEVEECKAMVEASWKAFLTFGAQGSAQLGRECLARFDEATALRAKSMGADGPRWLALIAEQRGLIFDEYSRDPSRLKRRLGVPGFAAPSPLPASAPPQARRGQSLGDLAVRTAVQATVRQTIASLFRWFR